MKFYSCIRKSDWDSRKCWFLRLYFGSVSLGNNHHCHTSLPPTPVGQWMLLLVSCHTIMLREAKWYNEIFEQLLSVIAAGGLFWSVIVFHELQSLRSCSDVSWHFVLSMIFIHCTIERQPLPPLPHSPGASTFITNTNICATFLFGAIHCCWDRQGHNSHKLCGCAWEWSRQRSMPCNVV